MHGPVAKQFVQTKHFTFLHNQAAWVTDEILSAFVELEREVLTVTFYLESIKAET